MTVCATPGIVSSRLSAAAAAAKAGTPGVTSHGIPSSSRRRICSAAALKIERSPECRRATSWPVGVRALELREDLVEVEVLRVDDARVRRGVGEDLGRDERAGVEADRARGDEALARAA